MGKYINMRTSKYTHTHIALWRNHWTTYIADTHTHTHTPLGTDKYIQTGKRTNMRLGKHINTHIHTIEHINTHTIGPQTLTHTHTVGTQTEVSRPSVRQNVSRENLFFLNVYNFVTRGPT